MQHEFGTEAGVPSLLDLSDGELITRLRSAVQRERRVTLGVLLLLIEMERRKLHFDRYSSLFAYCTDRLGYSRSAAGRRIAAARCLRDYPQVLPMLLDGRLNLSTLCILARVLNSENADELLAAAANASQEGAERLAARFGAPRPERERIRPVRSAETQDSSRGQSQYKGEANGDGFQGAAKETVGTDPEGASSTERDANQTAGGGPGYTASRGTRSAADDGSPDRPGQSSSSDVFDITFRANADFVEKVRRAQELVSSGVAKPTLAIVFARAIEEFLDRHDPARREARRQTREERRRTCNLEQPAGQERSGFDPAPPCESTTASRERQEGADRTLLEQSRRGAPENASNSSALSSEQERRRPSSSRSNRRRAVPRRLREQVLLRDDARCAFVGPEGRCPERRKVEIDHRHARAHGGSDELTNLRCYCAGHNQRAADIAFGRAFMHKHRSRTPATGLKPHVMPAAAPRRGLIRPSGVEAGTARA